MSAQLIRNRIKSHRRIRAGDLVPQEWNFRIHPEVQRAALQALYRESREVGFARSLLAYELPDGRLKLLDGHMRRELDPDMEVEVEVLDVTDDEARALLLSIDPLAALTQTQLHQRLLDLTPVQSRDLQEVWQAAAEAAARAKEARKITTVPEHFLLLLTCRDEQHQVELLERFHGEGLPCKALLS
jgi:predicted RecB family endonuclease